MGNNSGSGFDTVKNGEHLVVRDKRQQEHFFKIAVFRTSAGMIGEALEIRQGRVEGYQFQVLFDFDMDKKFVKQQLIEKIKRCINLHHLEPGKGQYRWQITKPGILRGRIEERQNEDTGGIENYLVIDGHTISYAELSRILAAHTGFQFKLEIRDMTDECR